MEDHGLIGIEARDREGEELGRISEVVTDEESGEVTHVMVERGEEQDEIPISSVTLDPDADFATVDADPSDEEPGDHAGDEVEPEGYAPAKTIPGEEDDLEHEGQLVSEPTSPDEAESAEDIDREDWEDESYTSDSGYPRTDAYIDPETGETTESYPTAQDAPSLEDAVALSLEDTGLQALSISDGIVELVGRASGNAELDRISADITALEEVFEVDTSGVTVG